MVEIFGVFKLLFGTFVVGSSGTTVIEVGIGISVGGGGGGAEEEDIWGECSGRGGLGKE